MTAPSAVVPAAGSVHSVDLEGLLVSCPAGEELSESAVVPRNSKDLRPKTPFVQVSDMPALRVDGVPVTLTSGICTR